MIGEVVVDAVALGDEVGAQHVVLAAGRQHGVDGAAGDRDRAPFARGIVRIEPGVADDIGVRARADAAGGEVDRRRIEEELGDRAAVDMHFLVLACRRSRRRSAPAGRRRGSPPTHAGSCGTGRAPRDGRWPPCAPMFQITGRWASRSVVPISSRRPFWYSRAIASNIFWSAYLAIISASGRGVGHGVVEQGGGEATRAIDLLGGHGRVDLAQCRHRSRARGRRRARSGRRC